MILRHGLRAADDTRAVRALLAVVGAVVVVLLVWDGHVFGAGEGPKLETVVKRLYADGYRGAFRGDPSSVRCSESPPTGELEAKREAWGARGPFMDCRVTLDDGSFTTSCWFKGPQDQGYRTLRVVRDDGMADDELSCEEFAKTPSVVKTSDVYLIW